MIVLDATVMSEPFRPRPAPGVAEWSGLCGDDAAITAITVITVGELLAGVRRLADGRRQRSLLDAMRTTLAPYDEQVLPFDDVAAVEDAAVVDLRERRGRPTGVADAQLAAICRVHHATCATRNVQDFVHAGVPVVNPWTP